MKKYDLMQYETESDTVPDDFFNYASNKATDPLLIESFGNLDDAKKALENYKSTCERTQGYHGSFYTVTAYAVEIYKADEDGEFIEGSDFEPAEEDRRAWRKYYINGHFNTGDDWQDVTTVVDLDDDLQKIEDNQEAAGHWETITDAETGEVYARNIFVDYERGCFHEPHITTDCPDELRVALEDIYGENLFYD